jgi:hypothetical protein
MCSGDVEEQRAGASPNRGALVLFHYGLQKQIFGKRPQD